MAKVSDVADFFIRIANANESGEGMSPMKLQKLLYYAQGVYLARAGRPLFEEAIKAWDYGPVVPPVYNRYRKYGNRTIATPATPYSAEAFENDELRALFDVAHWSEPFSATALMNMTHQRGTPWSDVYPVDKFGIIDRNLIQAFFSRDENRIDSLFDIDLSLLEQEPMTADGVPIVSREDADEWSEYDDEL